VYGDRLRDEIRVKLLYFFERKKNCERKEKVGEREIKFFFRVESVIVCMFVESISGPEVITS